MDQGPDAKPGMDVRVFTPHPGKEQKQQSKDGEHGSHFIQQVGLYHSEVARFAIETGNREYFGDQPFGFVPCKIGIKHRQPGKKQEQTGNFPAG